jgi:hypothetical protein
LILLHNINTFGAQAILGRALGVGEIRRIAAVKNIINAYHARNKSDDQEQWALDNPETNHLLNEAMLLASKDGR